MNQGLYDLFLEELEDIYSAENQIIQALPLMIEASSLPDLKEAFRMHLNETKNQVQRLKSIFSILKVNPTEKTCEAMKGILREANDLINGKNRSSILDAGIIGAAQKVEHYEIASYGTLRSFAKHLDLDSQVIDLLQETLDEEGKANKNLTKLAEGSFFSSGVNDEAAESTISSRNFQ